MAGVTKKQNLKFHLIITDLNCHTWLVATTFGSAGLYYEVSVFTSQVSGGKSMWRIMAALLCSAKNSSLVRAGLQAHLPASLLENVGEPMNIQKARNSFATELF